MTGVILCQIQTVSKMNRGQALDSNFEIHFSFKVKIFVFKMEKSIIWELNALRLINGWSKQGWKHSNFSWSTSVLILGFSVFFDPWSKPRFKIPISLIRYLYLHYQMLYLFPKRLHKLRFPYQNCKVPLQQILISQISGMTLLITKLRII